jgi:hypothetical protein
MLPVIRTSMTAGNLIVCGGRTARDRVLVFKNRLFSLILEEFEKTGGRVKIASTTLQLVDPPPLAVKLSGKPE